MKKYDSLCYPHSDGKFKKYTSSSSEDEAFEAALSLPIKGDGESGKVEKLRSNRLLNNEDRRDAQRSSDDDGSNFYLT